MTDKIQKVHEIENKQVLFDIVHSAHEISHQRGKYAEFLYLYLPNRASNEGWLLFNKVQVSRNLIVKVFLDNILEKNSAKVVKKILPSWKNLPSDLIVRGLKLARPFYGMPSLFCIHKLEDLSSRSVAFRTGIDVHYQ